MGRDSTGDAARALDDHFREQIVAYGHIAPEGEVHVSDHAVLAHCGGPSFFNRGTAIDLDQPDVAIGEAERFFGDLPHALWLREDELGDDGLDGLLRGRGYEPLTPSLRGVARTLPADDLPRRDAHTTKLLTDPGAASAIADAASTGFGFGVDDRIVLEDLVRNILRHARPFDHGAVYGVLDGGTIAAMGLLLCTADMAGLSTLATETRYRGQGMATAIITRALHDACAHGCGMAGVVTNPDSARLFLDLGFSEVSRYRVYRRVRR